MSRPGWTRRLIDLPGRLKHWREWELNPVVVKELRQSVRSRAVTGGLLLFLGILFATALFLLMNESIDGTPSPRLGQTMFQSFLTILCGTCLLYVPAQIGVRLAGERQDNNLDLMYITTLTPQRIIRGKFLCGAYLALLFISACMPFMVFTNLLRGIDLPTIFIILFFLFIAVCAAVQVAIFLACLPVSRLFRMLAAIAGALFTLGVLTRLVVVFLGFVHSGIGASMAHREFWLSFLITGGVILAGVVLLYLASVALISPHSANRALPLRAYVTAVWFLSGVLCLAWVWGRHRASPMEAWAIIWRNLLFVILAIVISNSDRLSYRVRRGIPPTPIKRVLAFPFYNGAAGGLVWVTLLLLLTYGGAASLQLVPMSPRPYFLDRDAFGLTALAATVYALDYALTALLIHRQFLARRAPRLAGILAVLLAGVCAFLPMLALFFLNRLSHFSMNRFQPGNMFSISEDNDAMHLVFAAAWLVLMLVLNARWFLRQWRAFTPAPVSVPAPPVVRGDTITAAALDPAAKP